MNQTDESQTKDPAAGSPAGGAPPKAEPNIEQRAEEWGRNLEANVARLERQLPKPVAALTDVVCLGVFLLAVAWLLAKVGWIDMPSRKVFIILAVAIYIISLGYRLARKPPKS